MASGPITSCQIKGGKVEAVADFTFLGSKITVDGNCSHEIRRWLLLGRKAMTNLDSVLKSRDYSANKGPYSQGYSLPSGHVWLWELDCREGGKWSCSVMPDSANPWTAACQAPLSLRILQARILEWIVIPFSRGSSQPRDWTQVPLSARRFFTIWATRKGKSYTYQVTWKGPSVSKGHTHCKSEVLSTCQRSWTTPELAPLSQPPSNYE